jgi:hypothetical protein
LVRRGEDLPRSAGGSFERRTAVSLKTMAWRVVVGQYGFCGPLEYLAPASVDDLCIGDLSRILE